MRYSIRCASAWQVRNEYVISMWRDFVTPSIARCVLSFGENNRSSENNNFTLVICLAHLAYIKYVFYAYFTRWKWFHAASRKKRERLINS